MHAPPPSGPSWGGGSWHKRTFMGRTLRSILIEAKDWCRVESCIHLWLVQEWFLLLFFYHLLWVLFLSFHFILMTFFQFRGLSKIKSPGAAPHFLNNSEKRYLQRQDGIQSSLSCGDCHAQRRESCYSLLAGEEQERDEKTHIRTPAIQREDSGVKPPPIKMVMHRT